MVDHTGTIITSGDLFRCAFISRNHYKAMEKKGE